MKLKRAKYPVLLFSKAPPANRWLWIGLICCLPWFVAAQEEPREALVDIEQNISNSETAQMDSVVTFDITDEESEESDDESVATDFSSTDENQDVTEESDPEMASEDSEEMFANDNEPMSNFEEIASENTQLDQEEEIVDEIEPEESALEADSENISEDSEPAHFASSSQRVQSNRGTSSKVIRSPRKVAKASQPNNAAAKPARSKLIKSHSSSINPRKPVASQNAPQSVKRYTRSQNAPQQRTFMAKPAAARKCCKSNSENSSCSCKRSASCCVPEEEVYCCPCEHQNAPKRTCIHHLKSKKAVHTCKKKKLDRLRPIYVSCRGPSAGLPPLPNGNIIFEGLYWEALEESLRYAMKNWTATTPSSPAVNQKLGYDPGLRVSVYLPLTYDEWAAGLVYTYFYSIPPVTRVDDPNGDLFAAKNFALISPVPWQRAYSAKAKWTLKMNVIDLEISRPFVISKSLMLQPLMGGKACFVRQRVDVHYVYSEDVDQNLTEDISNAQRIRASSSVWGVGPEIGCEMRFLIPKHVSLSIKGAFSALLGIFSGSTVYSEYLGVPNEADLKEKKTALFEVGQVQCGLSKWWKIKNSNCLELTLGWESQIWWGQMRMNWWSTEADPPTGATLTVKGPFLKASWTF